MIRVLIKATSPVVRAGLESLIRSHASFQVVHEFVDDTDARDGAMSDEQAEVVVAEIEGRDDESTAEVIDEATSGVPVVLLVRGPATEWIDVLRQGVKAVLPSHTSGTQIYAAIEAAAAGLVVVPPGEIESLLHSPRINESPEAMPEALTPREIEVLRSMAEGVGNKEIASRLGISEHTVKFHVASVMGKLGAGSRTEAVIRGIRQGLVLI